MLVKELLEMILASGANGNSEVVVGYGNGAVDITDILFSDSMSQLILKIPCEDDERSESDEDHVE